MGTPFAPELQRPWQLVELRMLPDGQVVITVEVAEAVNRPEPTGRSVGDVMSWPDLFNIVSRAEFRFSDVVHVAVTEDVMDACGVGRSVEYGNADGSFRRVSASTLLDNATAGHTERAETFRHYRLLFLDQVLDVVCGCPPTVALMK
jgi:hypothetical protein